EHLFDSQQRQIVKMLVVNSVEQVFAAHGLKIFDVEELPTHGGSLRVLACRAKSTAHATGRGLAKVRADEEAAGFDKVETYE
ncbi:SAM-dependent methyltransferase, partial [Rhizobium ruizarguesonis]